jgi:hypothetical protein
MRGRYRPKCAGVHQLSGWTHFKEDAMITADENGRLCSPTRLLEMLTARFGAFEAIACLSIELDRKGPDERLPVDAATADALLEFADDLRQACHAASTWARLRDPEA